MQKKGVTDGVLFTTYPFLIPPDGREDGGPGSGLVDSPPPRPLRISFLPLGGTLFIQTWGLSCLFPPGSANARLAAGRPCVQQGARRRRRVRTSRLHPSRNHMPTLCAIRVLFFPPVWLLFLLQEHQGCRLQPLRPGPRPVSSCQGGRPGFLHLFTPKESVAAPCTAGGDSETLPRSKPFRPRLRGLASAGPTDRGWEACLECSEPTFTVSLRTPPTSPPGISPSGAVWPEGGDGGCPLIYHPHRPDPGTQSILS